MDHALAIAELSERRCQTPRRRALFYFPGCFMRRTDGCHVRAMQTLDLLIAAGFDLTIYGYRQHPVWPWTASDEAACAQRFAGARLVLEEGGWGSQQMARVREALSLLGSRARALALQLRVPGLSPALDKLKAEGGFDVVVVSYTAGIAMLNGLPSGKVIVDAHDLPSLERLRLRPGALGFGALLRLSLEIGLLAAADGVWCIAFGEYWFLREMLDKPGIRFVPPAVDPMLSGHGGEPEFDLLFIGSDNRWNAHALLSFLDSFVGWSRRWRLAVAGNVGNNAQLRARAELVRNVELLGFQDDLAGLYRRARAAICPVEGTGTKIKIVEALATGHPVFAAPGAMRGLAPGYEGCVFPLKEEAVAAILDDQRALDGARAACGAYARTYSFEEVRRTVEADLFPAAPQPALPAALEPCLKWEERAPRRRSKANTRGGTDLRRGKQS